MEDGAVVRPAISSSLMLAGKSVAQMCHFFEEVLGDYVNDELAGAADVVRGVLGDGFAAGAVGDSDADDRWVGAEVVVGREGRGVECAFAVQAGDPRDGARCDEADEQVVDLAMRRLLHVELHIDVSSIASLSQRCDGHVNQWFSEVGVRKAERRWNHHK